MKDWVFIAPLRVKPRMKAALEAIADKRSQSVSDVIREAIDKLIAEEGKKEMTYEITDDKVTFSFPDDGSYGYHGVSESDF